MRRIDSSTSSPTELDVPDKTEAGASPPKNQATRAPKEKPGGSGQSHVARQSEAEARAAQASGTEQAVGLATEAMTRSWDNLVINEKDAQRALDALGRLSPEQFKAAVNELASNGTLDRLGENMDADQRGAFLELARKKGMVELDAPIQAPKGAANPPAPARLYDNDPRLPTAMRDIIHAENLDRGYAYLDAFKTYQDRYNALEARATNAAQVRQLGGAVNAQVPEESFYPGDPGRSRYCDDWLRLSGEAAPLIYRTAIPHSEHMEDLKDQDRTGSFATYSRLKVEKEVEAGELGKVEVKGEIEVKHRDYGRVTHKESLEVEATVAQEQRVAIELKHDGGKLDVKGEGEVNLGPIHLKSTASGGSEKPFQSRVQQTVNDVPLGPVSHSRGEGIDEQGRRVDVERAQFSAFGIVVDHEKATTGQHSRTTTSHYKLPYIGEWKSTETVKDDGSRESEWSIKTKGPVQFEADSEGDVSMGIEATEGLSGKARANFKDGSFGGGIEFGPEGFTSEIGVEFQGLRPEDAGRIGMDLVTGRDESIHSKWPELEEGIPWDQLSPEARERAVRNAFDAESWAEAIRNESTNR